MASVNWVGVAGDHPRIRGEHDHAGVQREKRGGSSPHTRGARPGCLPRPHESRIIPAYAGSTTTPSARGRARWDHPRIRGEHDPMRSRTSCSAGSSPHTRGARRRLVGDRRGGRIIPAYAGSTAATTAARMNRADHPRIRGEHDAASAGHLHVGGSSPHTRGAHGQDSRQDLPLRIIPAYAGSTGTGRVRRGLWGDHPRIRGEHRLQGMPVHPDQGSSPHTRGAPGMTLDIESSYGIIPAYAGSTAS